MLRVTRKRGECPSGCSQQIGIWCSACATEASGLTSPPGQAGRRPGEHEGACCAWSVRVSLSSSPGGRNECHASGATAEEPGMNRPRVLLADDHRMLSEGLKTLLQPHFDVVGIVSDGGELVAAAKRLEPDVVVLDISMPSLNGIELPASSGLRARAQACFPDNAPRGHLCRAGAGAGPPASFSSTRRPPN